jgi:hypothetical protein
MAIGGFGGALLAGLQGVSDARNQAYRNQLTQQQLDALSRTLAARRLAAQYAGQQQQNPLAQLANLPGGNPTLQPQAPAPLPAPNAQPQFGASGSYDFGAKGAPSLADVAASEDRGTPGVPEAGAPPPTRQPLPDVPQPGGITAGAGGGASGAGTGGVMLQAPTGEKIPLDAFLGHRESFTTMLNSIRDKAPPGTDPAVIFEAASLAHEQIAKDARDPYSLAMLKAVLPDWKTVYTTASREKIAAQHDTTTRELGGRRLDITESQGARRLEQGDKRLEQGERRLDLARERVQSQRLNQLQNSANREVRAKAAALRAQRQQITDKAKSDPLHQLSDEDMKALDKVDQEIVDLLGSAAQPSPPQAK